MPTSTIFIFSLSCSIVLTSILIPPLKGLAMRIGLVDRPDERKVHSKPIPNCGGIAVLTGSLVPMLFTLEPGPLATGVVLGSLCLLVEGLVDDLRGLGYRTKFAGQFAAAWVTLQTSGLGLQSLGEFLPESAIDNEHVVFLLNVIFLMATTNMINLADGLDGLAGGICLLIFTCTGLLSLQEGDFATFTVCICMAGGIMGFLRYNTHPASIFLGDTGSQFLGFMTGIAMLMLLKENSVYSPVLTLYILGIPLFDTLFSIIRRGFRRQPIFEPDNRHLHHRLLELGISHDHVVITMYTAQFAIILLGWNLHGYCDFVMVSTYLALILVSVALLFVSSRFGLLGYIHACRGIVQSGNSRGTGRFRIQRLYISRVAWKLFLLGLFSFFIIGPFFVKTIPAEAGFFSIFFLMILAVVRLIEPGSTESVIKIAAYSASIYFVVNFDMGEMADLLWNISSKHVIMLFFFYLGGCYGAYIIATPEPVPVTSRDYLLLALALFMFLLPDSILIQYSIHTISIKTLLMFLSFKLIFHEFKNRRDYLVAGAIPFLILIVLRAFRFL